MCLNEYTHLAYGFFVFFFLFPASDVSTVVMTLSVLLTASWQ